MAPTCSSRSSARRVQAHAAFKRTPRTPATSRSSARRAQLHVAFARMPHSNAYALNANRVERTLRSRARCVHVHDAFTCTLRSRARCVHVHAAFTTHPRIGTHYALAKLSAGAKPQPGITSTDLGTIRSRSAIEGRRTTHRRDRRGLSSGHDRRKADPTAEPKTSPHKTKPTPNFRSPASSRPPNTTSMPRPPPSDQKANPRDHRAWKYRRRGA